MVSMSDELKEDNILKLISIGDPPVLHLTLFIPKRRLAEMPPKVVALSPDLLHPGLLESGLSAQDIRALCRAPE
jgi:hypothetical protein